jgi:hypothetical protein
MALARPPLAASSGTVVPSDLELVTTSTTPIRLAVNLYMFGRKEILRLFISFRNPTKTGT